MTEDPDEIWFADRVEDPRTSAILDQPQCGLRSIGDGQRHFSELRNICEVLSGECRVKTAAGKDHVARVAATALFADEAGGLGFDPGTCRRIVETFEQVIA